MESIDLVISERKMPPDKVENKKRKPSRKKKRLKSGDIALIQTIAIIVMAVITFILGRGIVNAGATAAMDSYRAAYDTEKSEAYETIRQYYYDSAESTYHVRNRVSISVGELREGAKLEVLNVSDVEYIVENSSDNSNGIYSWLEVPGNGTFIVDLQAAEFVVDDERQYVLVRAPYPELTDVTIDYANVKKLFFKNDLLNDSYRVGEDLARKQLGTADALIKKEFESNEHYYKSAQEAAISSITCLVQQMNPNVENLTVEVEFY